MPTTFKETWTWASLRTGAEAMHPFEYFKFRYYEKWLMGISQFFVDKGYIAADELDRMTGHYRIQPDAPLPDSPSAPIERQVVDYLLRGNSPLRSLPNAPRFAEGQDVYVADPPPVEHTRLPGYLRNKKGTVIEVYAGAFGYFCSTGPDGIGTPMPVYRVAFEAGDIWGDGMSEPNTTIHADLFEVYLKEAP